MLPRRRAHGRPLPPVARPLGRPPPRRLPRRPVPLSPTGASTRPSPPSPALPPRHPVTNRRPRPDAAGVTSLLCAAALLEPKNLVVALPSRYTGKDSPAFFLRLPPHVSFPALETLSLSGCHVRFDSLLPCCPRLRVLSLKLNDLWYHEDINTFMSLHSASLQELSVDVEGVRVGVDAVDLVAPQLKRLTVSLVAAGEVTISVLAPMLDKLSWQWYYPFHIINFGLWQFYKLRLHTPERQGDLPSLHIHAHITSSIVHGEVDNSIKEIEKHLIANFSALELHLIPKGHDVGAFVFHLLGMKRYFRAAQRLNVIIHRSSLKEECPIGCACDHPDWRSQTITLTALEQVHISGFEGDEHEIDFLNLIFTCAPMLKRMIVELSQEVLSRKDACTQICNIFDAYSSVDSHLIVALV